MEGVGASAGVCGCSWSSTRGNVAAGIEGLGSLAANVGIVRLWWTLKVVGARLRYEDLSFVRTLIQFELVMNVGLSALPLP